MLFNLMIIIVMLGQIIFLLYKEKSKPKYYSARDYEKLSDMLKSENGIVQFRGEPAFLPNYYAQESGLYYNPATNKLKLAGPKTRLTSLRKLGYTEFIGEL